MREQARNGTVCLTLLFDAFSMNQAKDDDNQQR